MTWWSRLLFWPVAFGFFLLFSASLEPWHLIAAAGVATLGALIFGGPFSGAPLKALHPVRWAFFFAYVAVFLWECIKANVDVAYRVLHPDLPIRPGIVRIRTALQSPLGRTFLANSVTMTPGTLSVDLIEDRLYVHWIQVRSRDPQAAAERIAGRFERLLARVFE